jgi:microcompartment protein CcmK/EutM
VILARVIGRLTSTIHHPDMSARKILVCERLRPDRRPAGGSIIALDAIGAGAGETVLVLDEGNGARQILGRPQAPVRSLVVAIVDDVG